jgi:DNA-directed RNA polymerase sigma subunit (sigma70/sigma32)
LERRRQVAQAHAQLAATGREPSITDLATATTLSTIEVAEARAPTRVASLDESPVDRVRAERVDQGASPEVQVIRAEEERAVRRAVGRLRSRKRAIVTRHFGLAGRPETLADIARELELSPERAKALKDEALNELAIELEPAV